jgi:Zn finger protein HypA/HybF involved in hydrogenase expression
MIKLTKEQVEASVSNRGIKLLSASYLGSHVKHAWQCSICSHKWDAEPASVRYGCGCPKCAGRAYTIDDIRQLGEKNGFKLISNSFDGTSKKHEWQCKDGHTFYASPCKIRNGQGCPTCHTYRGEEKCRFVFEQVTGKKFPPLYRAFGTRLQLDGYCEELKIAFEYHGMQHFKHIKYWHKGKNTLERQQDRDQEKRDLCKAAKVVLLEIMPQNHDLEFSISMMLGYMGIPVHKVDWSQFKGSAIRLDEVYLAAAKLDLTCLEKTYISARHPMWFRCDLCGREYQSTANDIKNEHGCLRCSGRMKLTVDDMQKMAAEKGLKFLSKDYINARTKHAWKCLTCEHVWASTPARIRQGKLCPKCGRAKAWINRKSRHLLTVP